MPVLADAEQSPAGSRCSVLRQGEEVLALPPCCFSSYHLTMMRFFTFLGRGRYSCHSTSSLRSGCDSVHSHVAKKEQIFQVVIFPKMR